MLCADGDLSTALKVCLDSIGQSDDIEDLTAGQPEALDRLAGWKLKGHDAHADQVTPVDPLIALCDDRPDPEQPWPLGCPVPRRSRAVLLPRQDEQGDPLCSVLHRRVKDRHLRSIRQMRGHPALDTRYELVFQPHVGKRPAHHHFVVAAS